ncbi:hypothetical protein TrST_g6502 [Triparma strigata]|uniref:EGF-like domain-containing protein n=1 Tax=Triparma strigata TaxID=1606541 RepID=A0A9W7EH34_9STRA|nr:hypothetical protein TrST_g6502 [Triparma strigata]
MYFPPSSLHSNTPAPENSLDLLVPSPHLPESTCKILPVSADPHISPPSTSSNSGKSLTNVPRTSIPLPSGERLRKLSGVSSHRSSLALAARLFLLVLVILVTETRAEITLSGSSTRSCYVSGACFGTGSADGMYSDNEACTFTFSDDVGFAVGRFDTESNYDKLTVNGNQYSGTSGPSAGSVTAGQEITWSSDGGGQRPGFEICTGDPCVASTSPSDDGSDGNFYCINGGTAGGLPGSCTCTCKVGSEGPNCATVSATCPADMGYSGTPPDCIAGPIVLGGSSTGSCYVNGDCFGTGSVDGTYSNNEACTFTFSDDAGFAMGRFDIYEDMDSSCSYGSLMVDSTRYCGTSGPSNGLFTADQQVTFTSSEYTSEARSGFEICTGDPCVASTSPSDDGSDGNFYCINGGTAGGIPGSCTCTCTDGYGSSSCELPPCVASTSPSDDGSDGNFFCINGGTVVGLTGYCTCTSCISGRGPSCEIAGDVLYANDHPVLFNFISNVVCDSCTTGNNIVDNGDSLVVGVGTFTGEPHATEGYMYGIDGIFFSLVCSGAIHTCVLDGSRSIGIMAIIGTGGGIMRITGIYFLNGYFTNSGGALRIQSGLVSLEACKLSGNQASSSAGCIYAEESGTMLNFYATSFIGNSASGSGNDIFIESGASVTVHSTCPPDWSGTPAAGSELDAVNFPPATISGTTKSFDIG